MQSDSRRIQRDDDARRQKGDANYNALDAKLKGTLKDDDLAQSAAAG